MKGNIFEIQEELRIASKDKVYVLEKGDKIKVISEGISDRDIQDIARFLLKTTKKLYTHEFYFSPYNDSPSSPPMILDMNPRLIGGNQLEYRIKYRNKSEIIQLSNFRKVLVDDDSITLYYDDYSSLVFSKRP